jgi:CubicO group peptidase (beta-lactamase class C family)
MALLGHALARQANTTFESLIQDRICRPLHLDSTCLNPTPALKARLAMGHEKSGDRSPPWNLQAYGPAGGIHSTANDLLKYAAAHAGLTAPGDLTPAIQVTHQLRHTDVRGLADVAGFGSFGRTAMPWSDRGAYQPPGSQLLAHAGGAGSYHAWVGFDLKQHRGVVVLTTDNDLSAEAVGWTLLQRKPLNADSAKTFAREIVGIGVALEQRDRTHALAITKVFPNSPAARAGLAPGTIIQSIDGLPTQGKSLADCAKLLRGSTGTKVRLELLDPAGKITVVELTRQPFLTTAQ